MDSTKDTNVPPDNTLNEDLKSTAMALVDISNAVQLQLNALAAGETVQISGAVVTTLLTLLVKSVNSNEDVVVKLTRDNEIQQADILALKAENEILHRSRGVYYSGELRTFHKFPLLPLEIRLAIWDYAISAPKVIAMAREPIKRRFLTPALATFSTCQESREASRTATSDTRRLVHLSSYSSLYNAKHETDILWRVDFPKELDEFSWNFVTEVMDEGWFRNLAFDYETWYDAVGSDDYIRMLRVCFDHKIISITLVIDGHSLFKRRDLVFRAPRASVDATLTILKARRYQRADSTIFRATFDNEADFSLHTWEQVEDAWRNRFERVFHESQSRWREFLDGNLHLDQEDEDILADCTAWHFRDIPKIRFMEATTFSV